MARDDMEYADEEPAADSGAGLANAMIITTGIVLVIACWLIWTASADSYGVGMLS